MKINLITPAINTVDSIGVLVNTRPGETILRTSIIVVDERIVVELLRERLRIERAAQTCIALFNARHTDSTEHLRHYAHRRQPCNQVLRTCFRTRITVHYYYCNTEAVLKRQLHLLAILLRLGGYFPKDDASDFFPEKCLILLNIPAMSFRLISDEVSDIITVVCREVHRNKQLWSFRCYCNTHNLSIQLYRQLLEVPSSQNHQVPDRLNHIIRV